MDGRRLPEGRVICILNLFAIMYIDFTIDKSSIEPRRSSLASRQKHDQTNRLCDHNSSISDIHQDASGVVAGHGPVG